MPLKRFQKLEEDPDFLAWAERVKAHVVPMIQGSAMCVSLVPRGPTDIKFAVELGLSIMLDKPIVAVLPEGADCPPALAKVAAHVVHWNGENTEDLMDAITATVGGWDE